MQTDLSSCRLCSELENAVRSAQKTDAPNILLGLTEAGNRNRIEQRRETLLKTEANLAKHMKAVHNP